MKPPRTWVAVALLLAGCSASPGESQEQEPAFNGTYTVASLDGTQLGTMTFSAADRTYFFSASPETQAQCAASPAECSKAGTYAFAREDLAFTDAATGVTTHVLPSSMQIEPESGTAMSSLQLKAAAPGTALVTMGLWNNQVTVECANKSDQAAIVTLLELYCRKAGLTIAPIQYK